MCVFCMLAWLCMRFYAFSLLLEYGKDAERNLESACLNFAASALFWICLMNETTLQCIQCVQCIQSIHYIQCSQRVQCIQCRQCIQCTHAYTVYIANIVSFTKLLQNRARAAKLRQPDLKIRSPFLFVVHKSWKST